jgi:hypothetical protein
MHVRKTFTEDDAGGGKRRCLRIFIHLVEYGPEKIASKVSVICSSGPEDERDRAMTVSRGRGDA